MADTIRLAGLLDRANSHPLVGTAGYDLPVLHEADLHSFADLRRDAVPGIRIVGSHDCRDSVLVMARKNKLRAEIRIHTSEHTSGSLVVFGEGLDLHGDIRLMSRDQVVILSGGEADCGGHSGRLSVHMWHQGQVLFIGRASTTNGTSYVLTGESRSVIVGNDCMFASDVWIATHDQHALFDMSSGETINEPGDIVVEPHVWLCDNVKIFKNVLIGLGSTVGAMALVTKSCPRFAVLGGVPARVVRGNTSWDRSAFLRPTTMSYVRELAAAVAPYGMPNTECL